MGEILKKKQEEDISENSKKAEVIDLGKKRQEIKDGGKEKLGIDVENIKENYKEVINFRKDKYNEDIEADPSKKMMLSNLETHNEIVLEYAIELAKGEKLSKEDEVTAIIATIMHDSGKLSSGLLNHHERGVEYSREMLERIKKEGKKFEGLEITEEIGKKIEQAIERHMNHPFLVAMNKGEKFPAPETVVDKVVFDADMLANIGFKNVAFRLASEKFLKEDSEKAIKNNTDILEESFKNVMEGVINLDSVVLLSSAKDLAESRIGDVKKIFEHLKKNNKFKAIQDEFFKAYGKPDINTVLINEEALKLLKKLLNEEIAKAAMDLDIDGKIVKNFIM